jgi:programmed cell death protein 5
MADSELDAIRKQRMAELQRASGGNGGASAEQQEEAKRQQQDMKNSMLSQLLTQQARARLNTLALTKPEKAQQVENMIIQMARSGQIMDKLSEEQLISLLERISEKTQKKTVVNVSNTFFLYYLV